MLPHFQPAGYVRVCAEEDYSGQTWAGRGACPRLRRPAMSSSLPTLLSPSTGPRLIVYHQTFHDADGTYHSLLPLLTSHTGITHVILAALHLNHGPGNLTLNDHLPDDERYAQLWGEVRWLQGSGVRVLAMLGGAAKGSFERLSGDDESEKLHVGV